MVRLSEPVVCHHDRLTCAYSTTRRAGRKHFLPFARKKMKSRRGAWTMKTVPSQVMAGTPRRAVKRVKRKKKDIWTNADFAPKPQCFSIVYFIDYRKTNPFYLSFRQVFQVIV